MRGRKPIYAVEECAEVAQRLAAGESPTAIAKSKGWPRTSVIQCSKSARLPANVAENLLVQTKTRKTEKVLRLWGEDVEKALERIGELIPKADAKGISALVESLVELKSTLPSGGSGGKARLSKAADETCLIFERFTGSRVVGVAAVERVAPVGLGGSNADVVEAAAEAAPSGEADAKEAG
ncbi:MAG: hypothetical protein AABZ63_02840 [Actinomycetota bacterium]